MRRGVTSSPERLIVAMTMVFAFLLVALIGMIAPAWGEPWLVVKPDAAVEWYEVTGLPTGLDGSHLAPLSTLKLKNCTVGVDCMPILDVGMMPVSVAATVKVKACKNSPTGTNWPEVCSDETPFSFTPQPRPASIQSPGVRR